MLPAEWLQVNSAHKWVVFFHRPLSYYWGCKDIFKVEIINFGNLHQREDMQQRRDAVSSYTSYWLWRTYNIMEDIPLYVFLSLLMLSECLSLPCFSNFFYVFGNKLFWNKHVQSPLQLKSFSSVWQLAHLLEPNCWIKERKTRGRGRGVDYQRRICYQPEHEGSFLFRGATSWSWCQHNFRVKVRQKAAGFTCGMSFSADWSVLCVCCIYKSALSLKFWRLFVGFFSLNLFFVSLF